jgi:hypothetical protein
MQAEEPQRTNVTLLPCADARAPCIAAPFPFRTDFPQVRLST